jgi:hypothetical protein
MEEFKQKIFKQLAESGKDINLENLNEVIADIFRLMDNYFKDSSQSIFEEIKTNNISLASDVTEESLKEKVVVIGDLHCDYHALQGVFEKLSVSDYDYFSKATFVFLGDYIDRGALPFQTLHFLLWFKSLLGSRCILLKGNHDSFYIDSEKKVYLSKVVPSETIEMLKEYCNLETISKFALFFDSLPFFAFSKTAEKSYIFVHGGIPKDEYFSFFLMDKLKETKIPIQFSSPTSLELNKMLQTMLWGDPSDSPFKSSSSSSRFEFGSEQFEKFMNFAHFTHLIRGHEPQKQGFKTHYNDRLITVFTSGGIGNEHSYYADIVTDPAFLIIDEDGKYKPESVFTYCIQSTGDQNLNESSVEQPHASILPYRLFTMVDKKKYDEKKMQDTKKEFLLLNAEFFLLPSPTIQWDCLATIMKQKLQTLFEI